ncbi:MAG: DHH family phosphoesterase [Candidatus Bathyarchaeia archaeon]
MSRTASYEDRGSVEKHELLRDSIRESEYIAIITHQNADPDAVCAAYSVSWLVKRLNRKVKVRTVFPEGVSEQAKSITSRVKAKVKEDLGSTPPNLLLMVDTSSTWTLGGLKDTVESLAENASLVVVDHHHPGEEILRYSPLAFIDEEATSACEVVFKLFQGLGVIPSRKVSQILLTGVIFDSRHFMIADSDTFELAAQLCRLGASPSISAEMLHMPAGLSEKIARLKAAQRCRIYRVKDWIVAVSNLSSYQASGARALIGLGADLAVVMGGKKGVYRVNLRAAESFVESTRIHLGRDLAGHLGVVFDGSGGGHNSAAGVVTRRGSREEILSHLLGRISSLIGAPSREVK